MLLSRVAPRFSQTPLQLGAYKYRIDWSNPLTTNLIACYIPGAMRGLNLCGSGPVRSSAGPEIATLSSNLAPDTAGVPAPVTNYATVEGIAIKHANSQSGWGNNQSASNLLAPFNTNPMSLYWRGVCLGAPSGNTCLFGVGSHNTGVGPFLGPASLFMNTGAPNKISFGNNSGGTDQTTLNLTATPGFPATNTLYSVGGSATGAGVNNSGYFNGQLQGTAAFGASAATVTSGWITYGYYAAVGSRWSNTAMLIGCIWNRTLSDDDHMAMHLDPYQFLIPVTPTSFATVSQAIAASTIKFRRTFSPIGTRIGSRQRING